MNQENKEKIGSLKKINEAYSKYVIEHEGKHPSNSKEFSEWIHSNNIDINPEIIEESRNQ